jgi:hypothetical protein
LTDGKCPLNILPVKFAQHPFFFEVLSGFPSCLHLLLRRIEPGTGEGKGGLSWIFGFGFDWR